MEFLRWHFLFVVSILLLGANSFARIAIPTQLDRGDRLKITEILGFGTNGKILSDPYPLGGYMGFELGVQTDSIPTHEIANLGSTTNQKSLFNYPVISVGKGAYNNLDFFIHFIPSSKATGISEYGGIIRWGFYQMAYFPLSFSLSLSANSANINNQIITKNVGFDLTAGITTKISFLYIGLGQTQSMVEFAGGVNGITDSGLAEKHRLTKNHGYAGVGLRMGNIFLVGQGDYYAQLSYSLKLGLRF